VSPPPPRDKIILGSKVHCSTFITMCLWLWKKIRERKGCETGARCWWRSWLRHCTTSRKVEGSIPDGVTGIFCCHNPSSRTMVLGLTQPLTEMSTRNISWGVRATGAYGWQDYHLHVRTVLKSVSLNLLELSGPVQGLLYLYLTFKTREN